MENLELAGLLARLPSEVREGLEGQEEAFAMEMARRYLQADASTRADIEQFFASDGPRRVHEARLSISEGIPTSEDIEGWTGR